MKQSGYNKQSRPVIGGMKVKFLAVEPLLPQLFLPAVQSLGSNRPEE